jgi:hypothetical protein
MGPRLWWDSDDPEEAESFTEVERSWRGFSVTRYDVLVDESAERVPMLSGAERWVVPETGAITQARPAHWISVTTWVDAEDLPPGRRLTVPVAAAVGSEDLSHRGGDEGYEDPPEVPREAVARAKVRMARLRARMRALRA